MGEQLALFQLERLKRALRDVQLIGNLECRDLASKRMQQLATKKNHTLDFSGGYRNGLCSYSNRLVAIFRGYAMGYVALIAIL